MTENRKCNIIVLGEPGVGKTSLLLRFVKNTFKPNYICTVVVDILRVQISIKNETVDLVLWDTAGQERYKSLAKPFFRKADGMLLVYDVTKPVTFTELPTWLSDLRLENETAAVMIVGNKSDITNLKERVEIENVKEFADKNKLDFLEASAKSGENVEKIFQRLTRKMLNMKVDEDDSKITVAVGKPKKKSCCS